MPLSSQAVCALTSMVIDMADYYNGRQSGLRPQGQIYNNKVTGGTDC